MGLLTPIAIKLGSSRFMPRVLPQIVWLDKRLQRLTRGRMGFVAIAGLPSLTLSVPGRRAGIQRSTPLLSVPYLDGWLIAGSSFGDPKPPAWAANLRAADTATTRFRNREHSVVAVELSGAERGRAWQEMVRVWPNYEQYQARVDRLIPVFHLRTA